MDLDLTGKVAVVTGASKGIGLAIATALAGEGVKVVAGARSFPAANSLIEQIKVDLASADGPATLIAEAVERHGGLDILVNNVGAVTPRPGGFLTISDEDWGKTLTINFLACVRTTRAALPHLRTRGAGSIITVGSVNATLPDPLVLDYSAAKAAVAAFMKGLAKEVAPDGIRVNTISPGPVSTALWLGEGGVAAAVSKATGKPPEEIAAGAAAQSPTGKFTDPAEIAALALLLASPRTPNTTGATYTIDGGLTPAL